MKTKKGDFIEIEFTGMIKETNEVFDTTNETVAKDNGLWSKDQTFEPRTICLGETQVLKGLDDNLTNKEAGQEYEFSLEPEEAFGKKNAKLIQLISTNKFRQGGVKPEPGLQVEIDGQIGMIKTVTGGRTLVDFNHPLSGKELDYKVKIISIIDKPEDKVKALLKTEMGMKAEVTVADKKATVKLEKKLDPKINEILKKRILEAIPELSSITFE